MTILILGLVFWYAGHIFKRAMPALRQSLGDRGKGVATALILGGVVLMVIGFRGWDAPQVWYPPPFLTHINNLLVLLAFYLFAASGAKTAITRKIRHPQLTAFSLWTAAHLLVNGDRASMLLFGVLLVWAVVEIVILNRAEPNWTPAHPVPIKKEITAVIAALVAFAVVALIHGWIGPSPFGG
jgi:uncharacterized membrane protein